MKTSQDPNTLPLVTVGVLCFNTGEYVIEAIKSALNSDYKNIEIIVIDDCSSDGISSEKVRKFVCANNGMQFIQHHKNMGIPACFNEVLSLSSGKYLCFVCDDLITSKKIIDDIALFETLGDSYGVIHSISQTIDSAGNLYPEFSPTVTYPGMFLDSISVNDMIAQPLVNAITAMFRVSVLMELGGWDETLLFEDKPMWFKMALLQKNFKFRPVVSSYYRRHLSNTSSNIRYGYWLYQFQLYARYSQFPAARDELRLLLKGAFGAADYVECLDVYKSSVGGSVFLFAYYSMLLEINNIYFKWIRESPPGVVLRRLRMFFFK